MIPMKKNNKGFTLAELLIVVAIIAVLVAIAIPVFTTQLEKSKETTDIANLRSAYAAGQVTALTGYYGKNSLSTKTTLWYNPNKDGSLDSAKFDIGQGTATDGKADTSAFSDTDAIMQYSTGTGVKDQGIKLTFSNGSLKTVAFAAS